MERCQAYDTCNQEGRRKVAEEDVCPAAAPAAAAGNERKRIVLSVVVRWRLAHHQVDNRSSGERYCAGDDRRRPAQVSH